METGKFKVDVDKKTVTFGHKTKTLTGHVELTTTFDLSGLNLQRLLYDAGTARLIKWRATSGIKKLTSAEALLKFKDFIVDCSKSIERIKHVETEQEKRTRILLQVIMSGKDIPDVLTVAQAKAEILAMPVMKEQDSSEELSDEELSVGEEGGELEVLEEENPTKAA